jgi:hypothetical protein
MSVCTPNDARTHLVEGLMSGSVLASTCGATATNGGGEWDAIRNLSRSDKSRLAALGVLKRTGTKSPDQLVHEWNDRNGTDWDVDRWVEEVVSTARSVATPAGHVMAGHGPRITAYLDKLAADSKKVWAVYYLAWLEGEGTCPDARPWSDKLARKLERYWALDNAEVK